MNDARPAAAAIKVELPSCSICFNEYGPGLRKPLDLGCGHCICNRCYASLSITGPKTCPVDRKEWNNPHPSYELLHVVEQLQKNRGHAADPAKGADDATLPASFLLQAQTQAFRRRWRPPDPFRGAADALLLLSDLWRAVLWPAAGHDGSDAGGGGDRGGSGGMWVTEMDLREALGHIVTASPPWVHIAWRIAAPGLCVLAAHFSWRYIAAVAALQVPLFVAASAGLEALGHTWPLAAACAAAGVLGSLSTAGTLLRHGLLQHILAALLLLLLAAGLKHARVCDCLLARTVRSRGYQALTAAASAALWWAGLDLGRRRRACVWLLQGLAAGWKTWAWWGWHGAEVDGSGGVTTGAEGVAAAAAAGEVLNPPLSPMGAALLVMRGALTPVLLLLAVTYLEEYRSALPAGGPSVLPGSRLGGMGAVFGSAYRYDLDWLLLRGAVFLGTWCCSGSWRLATLSNVALHGCFLMHRMVAVNHNILRLFRSETTRAATAPAASGGVATATSPAPAGAAELASTAARGGGNRSGASGASRRSSRQQLAATDAGATAAAAPNRALLSVRTPRASDGLDPPQQQTQAHQQPAAPQQQERAALAQQFQEMTRVLREARSADELLRSLEALVDRQVGGAPQEAQRAQPGVQQQEGQQGAQQQEQQAQEAQHARQEVQLHGGDGRQEDTVERGMSDVIYTASAGPRDGAAGGVDGRPGGGIRADHSKERAEGFPEACMTTAATAAAADGCASDAAAVGSGSGDAAVTDAAAPAAGAAVNAATPAAAAGTSPAAADGSECGDLQHRDPATVVGESVLGGGCWADDSLACKAPSPEAAAGASGSPGVGAEDGAEEPAPSVAVGWAPGADKGGVAVASGAAAEEAGPCRGFQSPEV